MNEAVIFIMAVKLMGPRPQNAPHSTFIVNITLTASFDRRVVVQYQSVPEAKQ
jgi:hypothetical protein